MALDRKQISNLKGQLKAPKRARTMRQRYADRMSYAEKAYQEKLARELTKYI
jgi:hypothetical protein